MEDCTFHSGKFARIGALRGSSWLTEIGNRRVGDICHIGRRPDQAVHQPRPGVDTYVGLHVEVPLITGRPRLPAVLV